MLRQGKRNKLTNMTKAFSVFLGIGLAVTGCNNQAQHNLTWSAERIPVLKAKADSFYDLNEYTQAIPYFDTLIRIDSLNGEYYFKRGYCEAKIFMFPESTSDYLEAADLGYRKATTYFNLGLNYSIIDDSIAIKYFERCLKEDPSYVKAAEKIKELKNGLQMKGLPLRREDDKMPADTGYRTL